MKVAITYFDVNNIGGIASHIEQLARGFDDLGHEVHFVSFRSIAREVVKTREYYMEKWGKEVDKSVFGNLLHQQKGYLNPKTDSTDKRYHTVIYNNPSKSSLDNEILLRDAFEFMSSFDLIIHEIPVPTMNHFNLNDSWIKLFDVPVRQVGIIHDGNFLRTPWIYKLKDKFAGIACVHPCAYNTAKYYPVNRALILNPQNMVDCLSEHDEMYPYEVRLKNWISVQTYKGWKHVEDVIRSIPYMPNNAGNHFGCIMGGGGLEQSYMASPTKVKERYVALKKYDPDLTPELENKTIWQNALDHGMQWRSWMNTPTLRDNLRISRILIDPSWNLKYAKFGDHFNRVVVDAIKQGTIPVARNFGISTNKEGVGMIFKPYDGVRTDDNYLMIPHDVTPKEFANKINEYMNLPKEVTDRLQKNGRELLKYFDRKTIAQQYIDLSEGKPTGFLNTLEKGEYRKEIDEASDAIYQKVFVEHNADRSGKGLVSQFLSTTMRSIIGESFDEEAQNETED